MRHAAGAALAVALATSAVPPAAAALAFPLTIDKVWYRTGEERGAFGPKRRGDLRITPEALEFSARRAELVIPLGEVRMVSMGSMRGDVNTDWVVLSVERDGTRQLVGLRDGSKLGFGARTPEIHLTLRLAARQLAFAQFAPHAGLEPFTRIDHQVALGVPAGWSSLAREVIDDEGFDRGGAIVFSPEPRSDGLGVEAAAAARAELLRKVRDAETPAWVLDRRAARAGMSCRGFSERGIEALRRWLGAEPLLGEGLADVATAPFEPATVDGCAAYRLVARGRAPGGGEVLLDVRAWSDDHSAFALALRASPAGHAAAAADFERGVASVRLAVAR